MAERTGIEWTGATWNPVVGCTKVSPGCKNCYMYREQERYGQDPRVVRRTSPHTFNIPLSPRRVPPGTMVFVCSWSDLFHEAVDPHRPEIWAIMRRRSDVIFQVLTKRPERIPDHLPDDWGEGYDNVWLGTSVEDQDRVTRVADLLRVPARVRWLSMEPLLGEVDLDLVPLDTRDPLNPFGCPGHLQPLRRRFVGALGDPVMDARNSCDVSEGIDWVVVGGESGPHARPTHPRWLRLVRDQCRDVGVPVLMKQWGEWAPKSTAPQVRITSAEDFGVLDPGGEWYAGHTGWNGREEDPNTGEASMRRVGKRAAGRLLDGELLDGYPDVPGWRRDPVTGLWGRA